MRNAGLIARIFGTALLVDRRKLDVVVGVLGAKLGLETVPAPSGPFSEEKEREPAKVESRIATIQVVGTLAHRVSSLAAESGASSYETMSEELDRLAADPSVDGILLEVDSFGGEAAGCFDLANRIAEAKKKKPIYGVANHYAMSAGYAILSQATKSWVSQAGEVGSIGVVTTHMDVSGAAAKEGLRVTHIHAGKHKVDGTPWGPLAEDVRARIQAEVDQVYGTFCATVEQGRGAKLTATKAQETEALTYIGQKAVDAGLVDHVGTKADALTALREEITAMKELEAARAETARVTAENVRLVAEVAQLRKAAADRQASEDEALLERLRKESAEAGAPIDAADLEDVKTLLAVPGARAMATRQGERLLRESRARAGGAGAATAKTVKTAPDAEKAHKVSAARGELALRLREGEKVKLSDDGLSVVKVD
jgi:signal peptide peptidase SppA